MLSQSITFLFIFLPAVLILHSVFSRKICLGQYLSSLFGCFPAPKNGYLPFTRQYFIGSRFVFLMILSVVGSFFPGDEQIQRVWKTKLEACLPARYAN